MVLVVLVEGWEVAAAAAAGVGVFRHPPDRTALQRRCVRVLRCTSRRWIDCQTVQGTEKTRMPRYQSTDTDVALTPHRHLCAVLCDCLRQVVGPYRRPGEHYLDISAFGEGDAVKPRLLHGVRRHWGKALSPTGSGLPKGSLAPLASPPTVAAASLHDSAAVPSARAGGFTRGTGTLPVAPLSAPTSRSPGLLHGSGAGAAVRHGGGVGSSLSGSVAPRQVFGPGSFPAAVSLRQVRDAFNAKLAAATTVDDDGHVHRA